MKGNAMRYVKTTVYGLSLLLLVVAFAFGLQDIEKTQPFSFLAVSEEGMEEIQYWEKENGEYFVFLPSYADLRKLRIKSSVPDLHFNDLVLHDGMYCDSLRLETPYRISYEQGKKQYSTVITFLQSQNLPALYIDVNSGSMDAIHGKKSTKEAGRMRVYQPDGVLNYTGNLDSISGRGNTTFTLADKKPYNITLASDGNLLGMGAAKKWILLANAFDSSHIRNKFVFDFADEAGLAFSPESKWVDLYLNGEYAGLYLLSERNEIHPQRVNISEEGSFLVSKENQWRLENQKIPYVATDAQVFLRIHNSTLDRESLEQILQSTESAVLAENGIDPQTGKHWTELIDLDSWVRKYLTEEIFGGMDAGILSQFFYYTGEGETGRIYAGPVWDYDVSMGKPIGQSRQTPTMLFANCPGKMGAPWFHALYDDELFYNRLKELYREEFQPLLRKYTDERLPLYEREISQAARMNQIRWNMQDHAEQVDFIETYLRERMAFLEDIWVQNQTFHLVTVNLPERTFRYAMRPGESLPQLPDFGYSENTVYHGWFDSKTGEPFDLTQPIYGETEIYLKSETISESYVIGGDGGSEGISVDFLIIHCFPPAVLIIAMVIMMMTEIRHNKRVPTFKGNYKGKMP